VSKQLRGDVSYLTADCCEFPCVNNLARDAAWKQTGNNHP